MMCATIYPVRKYYKYLPSLAGDLLNDCDLDDCPLDMPLPKKLEAGGPDQDGAPRGCPVFKEAPASEFCIAVEQLQSQNPPKPKASP